MRTVAECEGCRSLVNLDGCVGDGAVARRIKEARVAGQQRAVSALHGEINALRLVEQH